MGETPLANDIYAAAHKNSVCVCVCSPDERLYIVMELIEGATLADHFNSLKEKKTRFEEHRIWNIFLQVWSGLFYVLFSKKK